MKIRLFAAGAIIALAIGIGAATVAPDSRSAVELSAASAASYDLPRDDSPWEITGSIQQMDGEFWTVAGFVFRVSNETKAEGDVPSVGTLVKAKGIVQADSTWLATEVRIGNAAIIANSPTPRPTQFATATSEPTNTATPEPTSTVIPTPTNTARPKPMPLPLPNQAERVDGDRGEAPARADGNDDADHDKQSSSKQRTPVKWAQTAEAIEGQIRAKQIQAAQTREVAVKEKIRKAMDRARTAVRQAEAKLREADKPSDHPRRSKPGLNDSDQAERNWRN